jgi:hypothetical protein
MTDTFEMVANTGEALVLDGADVAASDIDDRGDRE